MADKLAIMAELAKRGKLPADKAALYNEAVKRGLVPGATANAPAVASGAAGVDTGSVAMREAIAKAAQLPQSPPIDVSQNPMAAPSWMGPIGQGINTLNAATHGGMDAATGNMGTEISAGLMALPRAISDAAQGQGFDLVKAFNTENALGEKTQEYYRQLNPDAYGVGSALGSFGLMGRANVGAPESLLGRPAEAPVPGPTASPKGMIKRAAAQAGGMGAVYGFGQPGSIQERLQNAAIAGLGSAAAGAVLGKLGTTVASAATREAGPTVESTFAQGKAALDHARSSGALVLPDRVQGIVAGMKDVLAADGALTPSGKMADLPKIQHAFDLANDYASQPTSFNQLYRIRKQLGKAAASQDGDERRLAVQVLHKFDDSVAGLREANNDFAPGSQLLTAPGGAPTGDQAAQSWAIGRDFWHVAKKAEDVDKLISAAQKQARKSAATPVEQATRNKFDAFAEKPKNMRGFSPDERAQIEQVAAGTRGGNIAKTIGRLGPTTLASAAYHFAGPAGIATVLTGSPEVGAMVGGTSVAIGTIGRIISKLSTQNQAVLARELILNGGKVNLANSRNLPPQVQSALSNLLLLGANKSGQISSEIKGYLGSLNEPQAASP